MQDSRSIYRDARIFIGAGLTTAFPGEFVNNFLIMDDPGNFIFAMIFYAFSLSIFFLISRKYLPVLTFRSVTFYMVMAGVGWGLLFNEWILVGNHPWNQGTSALISQVSMVAYHMLVYTIPLALLRIPASKAWLVKSGRIMLVAFLFILIVGLLMKLNRDTDAVLGWTILTTYFLGYLPYAGYFVYRMGNTVKKLA